MTALVDPVRLKKLRFRAWRRGFREADLILGRFADAHGEALTEAEIDDLERLLDQADQHLYAWITEQEAAPAEFDTPMLARLRAFRRAGGAATPGAGA